MQCEFCIQRYRSSGILNRLPNSQIRSISVSPDPPVPGKNLTVHVDADVQSIVDVSFPSSPCTQTINGVEGLCRVGADLMLDLTGRSRRRCDCQARLDQAVAEEL
jgi:hypothetical protein